MSIDNTNAADGMERLFRTLYPITFRNDGPTDVPGYGAMAIQEVEGEHVENSLALVGQFDASQPNLGALFNSPSPVAPGDRGWARLEVPSLARYDFDAAAPGVGDVLELVSGEWHMTKRTDPEAEGGVTAICYGISRQVGAKVSIVWVGNVATSGGGAANLAFGVVTQEVGPGSSAGCPGVSGTESGLIDVCGTGQTISGFNLQEVAIPVGAMVLIIGMGGAITTGTAHPVTMLDVSNYIRQLDGFGADTALFSPDGQKVEMGGIEC